MSTQSVFYIVVCALLLFWAVGAYNRLVRLKNLIANAFASVDLHLKRRYDLIPNLVEAAKKYLLHERAALDTLTTARHQARAASDAARSRPTQASEITALAVAEQALSDNLARLSALAEAYPELKADDAVRELGEELTSAENNVAFARQVYNDCVLDYNKAQAQFPAMLIARLFGFAPAAMLQVMPGATGREAARNNM